MIEKGIAAKDLAVKVGISPTHLSYIVNSKRKPSFELLNNLADVLGVTMSELVNDPALNDLSAETMLAETGFETLPVGKQVKVPIIGTVTAGPDGLAFEDYQGEEWIDEKYINSEKYFYLRIKGDSMIGDGILPGDLALVRETPEVGYGALAVAIVNGEEGTIKRIFKNEDSIILQASNPKIPPRVYKKKEMENVKIIGEVKMTIRKY